MDKKKDLSIYRMHNAKDTLDTAKVYREVPETL